VRVVMLRKRLGRCQRICRRAALRQGTAIRPVGTSLAAGRPDARPAGRPGEVSARAGCGADASGCPAFRANTKATQARGLREDQHGGNTGKTAFPGIWRHS
jgi:hypothetical protein